MLLTLTHEDLRFKVAVGRKGPAHDELLGQPLPAKGRWDVRVEVRRGELRRSTARTALTAR